MKTEKDLKKLLLNEWIAHHLELREEIKKLKNDKIDYKLLLETTLKVINPSYINSLPNWKTIDILEDELCGDYNVFVLKGCGYVDNKEALWYMTIRCNSVDLIDTLENIKKLSPLKTPNDNQVGEYVKVCLYMIQKMKCIFLPI